MIQESFCIILRKKLHLIKNYVNNYSITKSLVAQW